VLTVSYGISGVAIIFNIFNIISLPVIGPLLQRAGTGVYGSDIYRTIAEGQVIGLSELMLQCSPVIFLFAIVGGALFLYAVWKSEFRTPHFLFAIWFIFIIWTTTQAGRFNNLLVPFIAIFCGYFTVRLLITLSNLPKMRFNINKIAIIIIPILLVIPSSFLMAHASVPNTLDESIFGEEGFWGYTPIQEQQWTSAMNWFENYDKPITYNGTPPAVISWWDYGFYIVSLSKHPTVADNFQNGIVPAGYFLTAQSEEEATAVMTLRLLQPYKNELFTEFMGLKDILHLPEQEMYEQGIPYLLNNNSRNIFQTYTDLQKITSTSIGYAAVTYRDLYDIYVAFPLLTGKNTSEFLEIKYKDTETNITYTKDEVNAIPHQEFIMMSFETVIDYKPAFYNSMAYKLFYNENLKHWKQIYNQDNIILCEYI